MQYTPTGVEGELAITLLGILVMFGLTLSTWTNVGRLYSTWAVDRLAMLQEMSAEEHCLAVKLRDGGAFPHDAVYPGQPCSIFAARPEAPAS